jgi:hypothetical protein
MEIKTVSKAVYGDNDAVQMNYRKRERATKQ